MRFIQEKILSKICKYYIFSFIVIFSNLKTQLYKNCMSTFIILLCYNIWASSFILWWRASVQRQDVTPLEWWGFWAKQLLSIQTLLRYFWIYFLSTFKTWLEAIYNINPSHSLCSIHTNIPQIETTTAIKDRQKNN